MASHISPFPRLFTHTTGSRQGISMTCRQNLENIWRKLEKLVLEDPEKWRGARLMS
jgi:hypothetical protein